MDEPHETLVRMGRGIDLAHQGDQDAARRLFAELWEQLGPAGNALHRMGVAHAMADVQDDVRDELMWDLRALEAAGSVTDEQAAAAGVPAVAGLYPSLHLNVGEAYRKLGDIAAARRHLELGQEAARALGDDGYATMIKGGLQGLASRLADAD